MLNALDAFVFFVHRTTCILCFTLASLFMVICETFQFFSCIIMGASKNASDGERTY